MTIYDDALRIIDCADMGGGNARVSHRYCGKRIESATGAYCPEHRPICFNLGAGRGRSKPSPTER